MRDNENRQDVKTAAQSLKKLLQNEHTRKIIIAVGVAAVLAIFLSSFFGRSGSTSTQTEQAVQTAAVQSVQDYKVQTEKSLTDLINTIEGVENANVLVTIEKSAQQVYAAEEKVSTQTQQDGSQSAAGKNQSNSSSETKYLIIKNADGTQQPIAVTEVQPTVQGVVVVCSGAQNPTTRQNITDAVTTALHISSARVCVIQSK